MKIITFGELMLRLSPPGYNRFFQTFDFQSSFCGAEANVAVSLSMFGKNSSFVTRVPDNYIGKSATMELRKYGVDTDYIRYGGERIGIFFAEKGASQRPSKVIYDRKHSAISEAQKIDFDWDAIFSDAEWFHITGITPALSESLAEICTEAAEIASKKGITVSLDINYRSSLWSETKANKVITKIMPFVDVCIGNEEDAERVLGIKAQGTNVSCGVINRDSTESTARMIAKEYGCKYVSFSQRKSITANENGWFGALYSSEKDEMLFSKEYSIHIVDRIGGGDAFAAGLIYGLHSELDLQKCVDFAAAAGCLNQTLEGDFCLFSSDDVWTLVNGDSSGRVKR